MRVSLHPQINKTQINKLQINKPQINKLQINKPQINKLQVVGSQPVVFAAVTIGISVAPLFSSSRSRRSRRCRNSGAPKAKARVTKLRTKQIGKGWLRKHVEVWR